jgi:hypothetical protein
VRPELVATGPSQVLHFKIFVTGGGVGR